MNDKIIRFLLKCHPSLSLFSAWVEQQKPSKMAKESKNIPILSGNIFRKLIESCCMKAERKKRMPHRYFVFSSPLLLLTLWTQKVLLLLMELLLSSTTWNFLFARDVDRNMSFSRRNSVLPRTFPVLWWVPPATWAFYNLRSSLGLWVWSSVRFHIEPRFPVLGCWLI